MSASIIDVAKFILGKCGPMSSMKLQKLCYYAQAWSLAWDDSPLFPEDFFAWRSGPVCPELYRETTGREIYFVKDSNIGGDVAVFHENEIETLDRVLEYYGDRDGGWLMELALLEDPWRQAWEYSHAENPRIISKKSIKEYYKNLKEKEEK